MKTFRCQQFHVKQSKEVFRVGTDGFLLGALSTIEGLYEVLEVGTGTGVVSLMLAQRNPKAFVRALDINQAAVYLAKDNFLNSPFRERVKAELLDFNSIEEAKKYDLVVCNPPFFSKNTSSKDILARQQVTLNFVQLIEGTVKILSPVGLLSVIIPSSSAAEFTLLSQDADLHLVKRINIFGSASGEMKRNILEFSFIEKPLEELDFVIEKSPRKFSDQYLEHTRVFHVFGE